MQNITLFPCASDLKTSFFFKEIRLDVTEYNTNMNIFSHVNYIQFLVS